MRFTIVLLLALGCEPIDSTQVPTLPSEAVSTAPPTNPTLLDEDGDGYASDQDCDDLDASIHPAAPDVPDDGIDQDCDGVDAVGAPPPTPAEDLDGDGYPVDDDCDDLDASVHPGAYDLPGDGIDQDCDGADASIDDDDGDGIPDALEAAGDTDGDGFADFEDADDDNDGVPTAQEAPDIDGDGIGDPRDTDGDGLPDHLDLDDDGDGLPSGSELGVHGTDPLNHDTDGGGIWDGQEVGAGTDPLDASDD